MAYREDKAFELLSSAHESGRLGHAFVISGDRRSSLESLTARVIEMINRDDSSAVGGGSGGDDMFDLFGEVEVVPEAEVVEDAGVLSLAELEGDLVRVVRPQMKTRIISVDTMRELERSMYRSVAKGKYKVGVVVDADRMRTEAANAFLKTLEEPPNGSILFLLTARPERLLATILSRCVCVPLMEEGGEREELDGEGEVLSALMRIAKRGFGSVAGALGVKSVFSGVLSRRKLAIGRGYELALKEELEHYKNRTDGEWLKGRERYYEEMTHSDYLFERSRFIDLLILWLGDLVRMKSGSERLDFAGMGSEMVNVAKVESLESLLRRMEAMEELRSLFETNVSEALALEVCFIKAFA